jgi:hypothetical protein
VSAPLQLIPNSPDQQITTEAQRRRSKMQLPPGKPQFIGRPIHQSGNFAIKLGQIRVSLSIFPAAVWIWGGRRLARRLASPKR